MLQSVVCLSLSIVLFLLMHSCAYLVIYLHTLTICVYILTLLCTYVLTFYFFFVNINKKNK